MGENKHKEVGKKQKKYICTGTCHAEITEEQYKNGLVRCGTQSCTRYGQPFTEVEK